MNRDPFDIREEEWVLPELRLFWADELTQSKLADIIRRHGLSSTDADKTAFVLRDVIIGKFGDEDIADALAVETDLDFDTILELQGDIYAELLARRASLLEEQNAIYHDLHREVPPPPPDKDAEELLAETVVEKSGLTPQDESSKRRLVKLIEAYYKEIRDAAETEAMLEKPLKTGGLSFAPDQAAALMILATEGRPALAAKRDEIAKSKSDYEVARKLAAEAKAKREKELLARAAAFGPPAQVEAAILATPVKEVKEDIQPANDASLAEEIAAIKLEVPTKLDVAAFETAEEALKRLSGEAIAASGLTLSDEAAKTRFASLIGLFFRDLRDELETKSKLTMPTTSGGFGLSETEAVRALAAVRPKYDEYHRLMTDRAAAEKRKFVAERTEKVTTETEKNEAREQSGLDRMFSGLMERAGIKNTPSIGSPPAEPEVQPPKIIQVVAADRQSAPIASGGPTAVTDPEVKPPKPPQPVAAQPPTAVPSAGQLPSTAKKAPPPAALPTASAIAAVTPDLQPITYNLQPPAAAPAVQPSEAKLPPPDASPSARPVVTDVKFVPKLTGPVEELRTLTVRDFRRLSRDPQEATLKIRDKLDLLEEQSFEIKTAGIKAWQASEVNHLYLELLRQSLEGKPVLDVIAERESKNQPVLSKSEFDAIMDLNRKLRFG